MLQPRKAQPTKSDPFALTDPLKQAGTFLLLCCVCSIQLIGQTLVPFVVQGKWGYCDTSYQMVLKPQFDLALPFENGRALVGMRQTNKKFRYGMIDFAGKKTIPVIYDRIRLYEHSIVLERRDSAALINLDGNPLIPRNAGRMLHLGNDIYVRLLKQKSKRVALLSRISTGIARVDADTVYAFSEGVAICRLAGTYFYINESGQTLKKFDAGCTPGFFNNGHALVSSADSIVLIDAQFVVIKKFRRFIGTPELYHELVQAFEQHQNTLAAFETRFRVRYREFEIRPRFTADGFPA